MIINLIRWVRGYVDFSAKGKFPERFINLSARNGIKIWNSKPQENGLVGSMSLYDYKKIRKIARKTKLNFKITKKYGMPFFVYKYKNRTGILAGFIVAFLIIHILSQFVWSIDVTPSKSLGKTQIINTLKDNGIYVGAKLKNIDEEKIERNIILSVDEVSRLSINKLGNKISVGVIEKIKKPEISENKNPCNLKASKDGVITDIKVSKGATKILKGSGVVKGDLLVSGIIEPKEGILEYVHANGVVLANVESEEEFTIKSKYMYDVLTDDIRNNYICNFLCFEFPCSLNLKSQNQEIKQYNSYNFIFNNTQMPIKFIEEKGISTLEKNINLNEKQALQIAEDNSILYEIFNKKESTLVSKKIQLCNNKNDNKDFYNVKVSYIFNENIAQKSEFSVTN